MGLSNWGKDIVSRVVGGDTAGAADTATASSATTITATGTPHTASSGGPPQNGGLAGKVVVAGSTAANMVYGVVHQNTTSVITVDQWHNFTAPETVASTPSATAPYVVLPGGAPCFYMGISIATRVFTASDNFLTNDGTTISEIWTSGGGLRRRLATWAHTNGNNFYTLANTFTQNGSDPGSTVIAKLGIFAHRVDATVTTSNSGGVLFQTLLSTTATLAAVGDNVTITDTVTVS